MIEITMPRLSDTMEEGAIATWHKKPGDAVAIGDVLVEIETDKATMEYEAYEAGTLSKILVDEGENVTIGTPIALIDDGTDAQESAPSDSGAAAAGAEAEQHEAAKPAEEQAEAEEITDEESAESGKPATPVSGAAQTAAEEVTEGEAEAPAPASEASESEAETENAGERQFASPLVRKLVRDNNLDISKVKGTGPGGRIIRKDIDELLEKGGAEAPAPQQQAKQPSQAAPAQAKPAGKGGDERRGSEAVPMSKTRRVIARRLGESAREIPHFYVTAVADAEELMKLRGELNTQLVAAGRPKVSVNDLLVRASALALREHPLVNASYVDDASDTMLVHHRVNVGVAVASDNGLVVPVIEDADQKTVTQLGVETKKLVSLANDKKLTPTQMSGGTFTISNLGMFGVEQFTAIINPPEGAILAVGGTKREPVVVGEQVLPRYRMRYTLSSDHRIIDGALAAQFLQTLTRLIENPWTIIA